MVILIPSSLHQLSDKRVVLCDASFKIMDVLNADYSFYNYYQTFRQKVRILDPSYSHTDLGQLHSTHSV